MSDADVRWVVREDTEDEGSIHVHHISLIVSCPIGDESCAQCRKEEVWRQKFEAFVRKYHPADGAAARIEGAMG